MRRGLRFPIRAGTVAIVLGVLLVLSFGFPLQSVAGSSPEHASRARAPLAVDALGRAGGASHVRVIVLLKIAPGTRRAFRGESQTAELTAVSSRLLRRGAESVTALPIVDGFAATVSTSRIAGLRLDPAIRAIVPDFAVHMPSLPSQIISPKLSVRRSQPSQLRACEGEQPLLEPEALQLTHTAYADASQPQAQALATGKGVTVAFLADGLDTNNPDFLRNGAYGAEGSHVFAAYQDFSGDGVDAPTFGGEAFGDASSIAAQGNQTYDLNDFVSSSFEASSPCLIRVRGVAPGASLVGLKVFGVRQISYAVDIVEAIQYAVKHGAKVISESFGFYRFPDNSLDPISLANDAAIRAGVTVVVSSGDSGTTGTVASPASDPNVITTGASTQFQAYEQTGLGASSLGPGSYLDDNISSLSSAGVTDLGSKSVDVVAPGDLGWALCSASPNYADCRGFGGELTNIQLFGGTSESAPLTAGEAALVIQTFRASHHDQSPSPALIKRIILSSATDLGEPGYEQGAGLINSLAAVRMARSYGNRSGRSGSGLLVSPPNYSWTGKSGAPQSFTASITNTGATSTTVRPAVLTQGPPNHEQNFVINLTRRTAQTFVPEDGTSASYVSRSFTVPGGEKRLDATIAWNSFQRQSIVALSLFDPSGALAGYSLPQGLGSYGHVDVRNPVAGTWRAIVWTHQGLPLPGSVHLEVASSSPVRAGSVKPALLTLAPGETRGITVRASELGRPGDFSGELTFASPGGEPLAGAVPIFVRTLVSFRHGAGEFAGTLIGGNGRSLAGSSMIAFDVPGGEPSLQVNISLDDRELINAILVRPDGYSADVASSAAGTRLGAFLTPRLSLFARDPQPGRWKIIFLLSQNRFSLLTSLLYSGEITFASVPVRARHVPDSRTIVIRRDRTHIATIRIRNTSNSVRAFFVDARSRRMVTASPPLSRLAILPGQAAIVVPPETRAISTFAAALSPNIPIQSELTTWSSSPDIIGTETVSKALGLNTVSSSLSATTLPVGVWLYSIVQAGPFTSPQQSIDAFAQVFLRYRAFDSTVSTARGDIWRNHIGFLSSISRFRPLWLAPGRSGTITVRFRPGKHVHGTDRGDLFVDSVPYIKGQALLPTGTEIAAIPYRYRVGTR